MRLYLSVIATALLVAACGDPKTVGVPPPATTSTGAAPSESDIREASVSGGASAAPAPFAPGLGGRTGELLNPDNSTMVFLYYDLAGIPPPIDQWVASDSRVMYGPAIDKPAKRVAVKAELEAGAAAVRGTGRIRLSLNSANLSDYDPTYGEFTVRALSPSSVVEFAALGQKVTLRFGNGRTAQTWRVPPAEAQAIRDRLSMGTNVDLDVLLIIRAVQPGPAGGTITADVVEYEMRESRGGTTLARVQVAR